MNTQNLQALHGIQGVNYNQTGLSQSAAVPMSDLDVFKSRLGEILNYVQMQGDRIDSICAKMTGGVVGTGKGEAGRPIATGTISEINCAADEILARLQRTDEAVSRLRQAI